MQIKEFAVQNYYCSSHETLVNKAIVLMQGFIQSHMQTAEQIDCFSICIRKKFFERRVIFQELDTTLSPHTLAQHLVAQTMQTDQNHKSSDRKLSSKASLKVSNLDE
eukprot:jgi/Picre1/29635/NNA_005018.t1